MCGICGVQAEHPDDLWPILTDLTESNIFRGEDAVGVSLIEPESGTMRKIASVRQQGSVDSPMRERFKKEIMEATYDIQARLGLGQTKFTTTQISADPKIVRSNTQPNQLRYKRLLHTNIPEATGVCNGEVSFSHTKSFVQTRSLSDATVDTRYALEVYYDKLREYKDPWEAAEWFMGNIPGAYTMGFSDGCNLFFFKDPAGVRPGVVGKAKGKHGDIFIFSSEDGFFSEFGIERQFYLAGGEAVMFNPGKEPEKRTLLQAEQTPCWYERHYMMRSFSQNPNYAEGMGEISNELVRFMEGRAVAELYKNELSEYDIVFAVPNSGISFRRGVSHVVRDIKETGASRKPGRGTQRYYLTARTDPHHSFVFSEADIRGMDGIGVEDSVVAGDTAPKLFLDWKKSGGGKLLLISAAPPMLFPCCYGVGFPDKAGLIASGAFHNGIINIRDGEITYDIHKMNTYVTSELREKIRTLSEKTGIPANPEDFKVVYSTIGTIRNHAAHISPSGRTCDYCISGRESHYLRSIPISEWGQT